MEMMRVVNGQFGRLTVTQAENAHRIGFYQPLKKQGSLFGSGLGGFLCR